MTKTMIDIMPIKCCKAQSTKLSSFKKVLLLFASLFVCLVFEVRHSFGDDIRSTYNVRSNINTNTETIKIGNSKTKNYNIQESNYLPTQLTQVVVNVPKSKKLRKDRPPTEDEFMIKRKILDVYDEIKREFETAISLVNSEASLNKQTQQQQQLKESENSTKEKLESTNDLKTTLPAAKYAALVSTANAASKHLNHLGKIIQALNPKYIATERVRSIAFADSNSNLDAIAASFVPLSETFEAKQQQQKQQQQPKLVSLELTGQQGHKEEEKDEAEKEKSLEDFLSDQLDTLNERFRELFLWDQSFIEALENVEDEEFSQTQLAYKRLILCLNDPNLCVISTKLARHQHEQQQQQQHELEQEQRREREREHQNQDQILDSDASSESDEEEEEEDENEIDELDETKRRSQSEEHKQEVVARNERELLELLQQQSQHKLDTDISDAIDDTDEGDEGLYGYPDEAQNKDYANELRRAKYEPPGFDSSAIRQQRTPQNQQQMRPQPQYQQTPATYPSNTATTSKQDSYLNRQQNPYQKQQISAIREPTKSLINRSKSGHNGINLSRLNEFKNFFAQQQLLNNSNNDNRYRNEQPQQHSPIQRQPLIQQQFNFRFNQQPVLRAYQQQQPQPQLQPLQRQWQRYRNLQANE